MEYYITIIIYEIIKEIISIDFKLVNFQKNLLSPATKIVNVPVL
jgi:hypothetical protein